MTIPENLLRSNIFGFDRQIGGQISIDRNRALIPHPPAVLIIKQNRALQEIFVITIDRAADMTVGVSPVPRLDIDPGADQTDGRAAIEYFHQRPFRFVIKDLPASEARNVLSEVLDTVDAEKRGAARANLRDEIAASLACHAAIKVNMPLAPEKMRWLIDRLLLTSSPTTCPHGRPVILRLATQDLLKGFHRI